MNALQPLSNRSLSAPPSTEAIRKAEELRGAFGSFVGETFYGQMLKSMRTTVGKPAYFHGGQAEETFRSQLDQQLAQELAEQTGDRFAGPMFEQQFPEQAELLRRAKATSNSSFEELNNLRRR